MPTDTNQAELTKLLNDAAGGDKAADEEIIRIVYKQLRLEAARRMVKGHPGQTLQPTALVHEAYIKLLGAKPMGWENRGQFFAAAAVAMRDILVDAVRRRTAIKRGGGRGRAELNDATLSIEPPNDNIVAINDAIEELRAVDNRAAEIVMLRFFVGLTELEVANALGISERTVRRDWSYARAWLHGRLEYDGNLSLESDG